MLWLCLKPERLFCLRFRLFTAGQVLSRPLWTVLFGESWIKSACPARVRTVGASRAPDNNVKDLKIQGRLARWLIAFGVRLLHVWERTLHYEIDDRMGAIGKKIEGSYIGALWHNRLLIFPLVLRRFFPERRGVALISASRDGDLLTDAIHRFGYNVIRGSSSRLGSTAILQLTEELASGRDVVITPDGPRGPA